MGVLRRRNLFHLVRCIIVIVVISTLPVIAADSFETPLSEIRTAFDRGKFDIGINTLTELLGKALQNNDLDQQIAVRFLLAEGYGAIGDLEKEIYALLKIIKLAPPDHDSKRIILTYDRLATAYLRMGQMDHARDASDSGLKLAKEINRPDLLAVVLNDQGSIQNATGDSDAALNSYQQSIELAREAGLDELQCVSRINRTHLLIQKGILKGLEGDLKQSMDLVERMPDSRLKALYLLSIGSQYWSSQ